MKIFTHNINSHIVTKNKLAPPFTKVEFDIIYGLGISYEGDLIENALLGDILLQSGSWFSYNNEKIAQGRENFRLKLKENSKLKEKIEQLSEAKLRVLAEMENLRKRSEKDKISIEALIEANTIKVKI